ncbi:Hypothetical predicted protein, partial [Paramuricea clavata]
YKQFIVLMHFKCFQRENIVPTTIDRFGLSLLQNLAMGVNKRMPREFTSGQRCIKDVTYRFGQFVREILNNPALVQGERQSGVVPCVIHGLSGATKLLKLETYKELSSLNSGSSDKLSVSFDVKYNCLFFTLLAQKMRENNITKDTRKNSRMSCMQSNVLKYVCCIVIDEAKKRQLRRANRQRGDETALIGELVELPSINGDNLNSNYNSVCSCESTNDDYLDETELLDLLPFLNYLVEQGSDHEDLFISKHIQEAKIKYRKNIRFRSLRVSREFDVLSLPCGGAFHKDELILIGLPSIRFRSLRVSIYVKIYLARFTKRGVRESVRLKRIAQCVKLTVTLLNAILFKESNTQSSNTQIKNFLQFPYCSWIDELYCDRIMHKEHRQNFEILHLADRIFSIWTSRRQDLKRISLKFPSKWKHFGSTSKCFPKSSRSLPKTKSTFQTFRNEVKEVREKMLESLAKFQKHGSGWRFRRVETLEIYIGKFQLLKGKGHMPLPKSIEKKKAIITMKNNDDECFKWAVTRALNLTEQNPERISKALIEHARELDWEGIEFPTPLNNIKKFEENNNIGINVFSADESQKARKRTNQWKKEQKIHLQSLSQRIRFGLRLSEA